MPEQHGPRLVKVEYLSCDGCVYYVDETLDEFTAVNGKGDFFYQTQKGKRCAASNRREIMLLNRTPDWCPLKMPILQ